VAVIVHWWQGWMHKRCHADQGPRNEPSYKKRVQVRDTCSRQTLEEEDTIAPPSSSCSGREVQSSLPLACPLLEALRHSEMLWLQTQLRLLCKEEGLRYEPFLCFARWHFVCRILETAPCPDPLIPSGVVRVEQGLKGELIQAGLTGARAERVCIELAEAAAQACSRMALAKAQQQQQQGQASPTHPDVVVFPVYNDRHAGGGGRGRGGGKGRNGDQQQAYDQVEVWCSEAEIESQLLLNVDTLERLRAQYIGPPDTFESQLFCLLARYKSLQGAGYQSALPDALFCVLEEELGVTHECFASPFNHFLPSYFSAFPDIDRLFGSSGSFFDQVWQPSSGSFEANPPFVEEVMVVMANKINGWLSASDDPLSFVVVVPGWIGGESFTTLSESTHRRCCLSFDKGCHVYKEGFQYRLDRQHTIPEFLSFIFVLQNEAGAHKWPVGNDALHARIRTAFAPTALQLGYQTSQPKK